MTHINENEKIVSPTELQVGDFFWTFGTRLPKRVISTKAGEVIYETTRGEKYRLPDHRKVIVDK